MTSFEFVLQILKVILFTSLLSVVDSLRSFQPLYDVTHGEGLFIDSNDNLYISDQSDSGSVHIINNDGSEVLQLTGYKGVGDAVVAPDGMLWVSDYSGGKIYLY